MRSADGNGPAARWQYLGALPYAAGLEAQRRLFAERLENGRPDTLLLLEHPPTITLGKRGTAADLRESPAELARSGVAVFRVGRGGAATVHGPGQLVGYPIVRLGRGGRGVRQYVAGLEEVLCGAAARFGVTAGTRRGHPGVWVGEAKLASIGVEVHRGVSLHGFALNVDMDLAAFAAIVPCGLPGLVPTDLSRACGVRVSVADAAAAVIAAWRERFGDIEEEDPNERGG